MRREEKCGLRSVCSVKVEENESQDRMSGDPGCARRSKMDRKKEIVEEAERREREREKILSPNGKRWREQKPERVSEVGCEFISSVSHLEPSAARLKFHLGRADVIKTNYAYGTVMPYHFIP